MKYDGAQKAAIILLALGEEEASNILKNLETNEVQRIARAMSQIKGIDSKVVDDIIAEFQEAFEESEKYFRPDKDFVRKLVSS